VEERRSERDERSPISTPIDKCSGEFHSNICKFVGKVEWDGAQYVGIGLFISSLNRF
jgi:hypothetical protein